MSTERCFVCSILGCWSEFTLSEGMHPTHLTFTSSAIKELEKVVIQKVDSLKWQQFIPES